MRLLFLPIVFLIVCTVPSISSAQARNLTEVLDSMLRGYDHRIRPHYQGPAVEVNVSMYIIGISSVSEKHMDFTMDLYFRQSWRDERLTFPKSPELETIDLDSTSGVKIWEPDTFFSNEKKSFAHDVTKPNTFTRISSDGKILKSYRLSITASCPMSLKYFPMDSQICSLEMESYGFQSKEIVYQWAEGSKSAGISSNLKLPHFDLAGLQPRAEKIVLSSGTYSRLVLDLKLTRAVGYYVVHVYMPVAMLVIISWTAFLLKDTLLRMVIGLSTTLTLTILLSLANAYMSKTSYVRAIDVYTGFSVLMVFATLLVHVFEASQNESSKIASKKINKFSIIAFPVLFIFFNVLYCIIYLSISAVNINQSQ